MKSVLDTTYKIQNNVENVSLTGKIKISSYIFAVYLVLLPLSTGLSGIIGNISLMNYIAVLYIIFVCGDLFRKRTIVIQKSLRIIYIYFFYTIISSLWNTNFTFDWYFTTFATTVLIFVFATLNTYSYREIELFIKAVIISSLLVVAVSVFNIIVYHNYRLFITISSTMDPNDFACGLCLIISVYIFMLMTKKKSLWTGIVLAIIFIIILLTGSRGAVLMVLGMISYWIVTSSKSRRFKNIIMLGILALFVYIFMADTMTEYLLDRFQISSILDTQGSGRLIIWKNAILKFRDSNLIRMIFGYGHGGFKNAVHYIAIGHSSAYESHNIFINALIEGGLVGLILLISSFCKVIRCAWKHNNIIGQLCTIGFLLEGLTLDAQSYRIFAVAFVFAVIINNPRNMKEISLK